MMHLDAEKVQRIVDGEIDSAAFETARSHTVDCESCRSRVQDAQLESERILNLLRHVDDPLPQLSVESVLRSASVRAKAAAMVLSTGAGRRKIDLRWAAALLIAVAAAGATTYVIPGSPLPDLVKRVLRVFSPPSSNVGGDLRVTNVTSFGGIQAIPGNNFIISFSITGTGSEALVSLTDSAVVSVRALQANSRFSSPSDSVVLIESTGTPVASRYEISIPRSARRIEILAAGRRVFLKDGGTVSATADSHGTYTIPLVPR